jgi:hypothetical protein
MWIGKNGEDQKHSGLRVRKLAGQERKVRTWSTVTGRAHCCARQPRPSPFAKIKAIGLTGSSRPDRCRKGPRHNGCYPCQPRSPNASGARVRRLDILLTPGRGHHSIERSSPPASGLGHSANRRQRFGPYALTRQCSALMLVCALARRRLMRG